MSIQVKIMKESRRLAGLIDEVLEFSKAYVDSMVDDDVTEEFKKRAHSHVHAKLIQVLFLDPSATEHRKTADQLKTLSKVVVDKQLEYHKLFNHHIQPVE